jgi:TonB family protein
VSRIVAAAVLAAGIVSTVAAQDVRDTIGPLEQSAKPSSPENPIPRRTSAAQARQLDEWRRIPGGRGGVQFQVTLDTSGRIGEIRLLGDPFVFTAAASVDEKTRRAIADAMVTSAADALRRWTYDRPAAPIKFVVVFAFGAAMEPSAVQRDEAPARSRGPAPASGSVVPPPRLVEDWPAAEGAFRVGGSVRPPRLTKNARPDFPRDAQASRIGGAVLLEALIGPDGKVKDVRVIRSSPLFDKAAVDAVRKWEYEPTIRESGSADHSRWPSRPLIADLLIPFRARRLPERLSEPTSKNGSPRRAPYPTAFARSPSYPAEAGLHAGPPEGGRYSSIALLIRNTWPSGCRTCISRTFHGISVGGHVTSRPRSMHRW